MSSSGNGEEYGHEATFVDEVPEELKCVVCHLVLRDPLQIMTCGHRFCSPCFNRMKAHAQQTNIDLQCPVDREMVEFGKVFEDRGVARSVGNLKTKCGNLDQGCEWTGDLRNLQEHMNNCLHGALPQQMNQLSMQDGNLDAQNLLVKEILLRLQKCEDDLLKKEKRLERCENDLMLKEKDIAQFKFTIEEMNNAAKVRDEDIRLLKASYLHLQDDIKLVTTKNDELVKSVQGGRFHSEVEARITVLEEKLGKVNTDMAANEKQKQTAARNTTTFSDELNLRKKEITSLNEVMVAFKNDIWEHIANLEYALFSRTSMSDGNKQDINLQWVMTGFKRKFQSGENIYSPLFHTSIDGYRFKLSVLWSGLQKGKLGLFLHLYRADSNEDHLRPFEHEYTFEIMDKWGCKVSVKVDFNDIRQYPSSFIILNGEDDARGGGFGPDDLITAPFEKYIINDSLLITCAIHM